MRKTWILLLVMVLLAVCLAVPAMAAETHVHGTCGDTDCTACVHTDWKTIKGDTEISGDGNYYLAGDDDTVAASVTVTGGNVTICLNGKTWENGTGTRPLTISGGAVVNIVDCSAQSAMSQDDDTLVSAGRIVGADLTKGGTVGGKQHGGTIYISDNATVYQYNGTITSGKAVQGGNVYIKTANYYMYGGVMASGYAYHRGGNIYFESGNLVIGLKDHVNEPVITEGRCVGEEITSGDGNKSNPNGGNIWTTGGTMTLAAGTIKNGEADGGTAGNVRIGGTFDMSGGLITGGKEKGSAVSSSANMQIVGAGKNHNWTGGTITGYLSTSSTKSITISGDVVVCAMDGNTVKGGLFLGVNADEQKNTKLIIGENGLGQNAKVAVSKTANNAVMAAVSDADTWAKYEQHIRNGQIVTYNSRTQLTYEEGGVYSRNKTDIYHCYCGLVNDTHDRGCIRYDVLWTAWDGNKMNPDTDTNYYLPESMIKDGVATTGQIHVGSKGTSVKEQDTTPTVNVVFDMNGFDIVSTGRAFQIHPDANFLLCNSKSTGGNVTGVGASTATNIGVVQCFGYHNTFSMMNRVTLRFSDIHDRDEDPNTKALTEHAVLTTGGQVIMYGGKIIGDPEAGTTAVSKGGAVSVQGGTSTDGTDSTYKITYCGKFYMYGDAEITGGAATNGGAVYVAGGDFYCYGGTITGGTAKNGGAVYITGGSFTAQDGAVINGGTATANGGAFYVSGGRVSLTDTTVNGGVVDCDLSADGYQNNPNVLTEGGGAFYVSGGTVVLDKSIVKNGSAPVGGNVCITGTGEDGFVVKNSTIENGTARRTKSVQNADTKAWTVYDDGRGANFYITGGTLEIQENSTVKGGVITPYDSDADDKSEYGGSVIFTNGEATVTVTDSELLGNDKNPNSAKRGGTLHIRGGATVSLTNTMVTATRVQVNGACVLVEGGTLNIYDGTTIDSTNCYYYKTDKDYKSANYGVTITLKNRDSIKGTLNMYGGRIVGGYSTGLGGGAVRISGSETTFNMLEGERADGTKTSGTIIGGVAAGKGGNVHIAGGTFNMEAGTVTDGFANGANGGNFYVESGAKLNLSGGEIKNGRAAKNSNGENGNGANIGLYGTLNMTGGAILQEKSNWENLTAGDGHNLYMNSNTAKANLTGGTINGWVFVADYNTYFRFPTVKLGGDIQICNDTAGTYSLKLYWRAAGNDKNGNPYPDTNCCVRLEGLTNKAKVGITHSGPVTGRPISVAITDDSDYTGIYYDTDAFHIQKNASNVLELVATADVTGAAVNDGSIIYSLEEAVAMAGTTGYVRLVNSLTNPTIDQSVFVDLNGHSMIGLTLGDGVELKLFDSQTADYAVEADEGSTNNYSGYGCVTLSDSNEGKVLRTVNTPKGTYGHNYRYVVVKDSKGYHAHRIYLAVKSTILYPNKPALKYRTLLRCDQLVAQYINAEGGGYGIVAASADSSGVDTYTNGDYTDKGYPALCWNSETVEENDRITQMADILTDPEATDNEFRASSRMNAKAYILLTDSFYGEDVVFTELTAKDIFTTYGVCSAGTNQSLKSMILIAEGKDPDALTQTQKDALGKMYSYWSKLMSGWNLTRISGYDIGGLKYGCLCGDPASENNPCAANGHIRLTWRPWDNTTTFPNVSGNYYLTNDVTLTEQGKVSGDVNINLNTMGKNISVTGNRRVANVYGVLNLTNFSYDGTEVAESVVQATGPKNTEGGGGNGGVLLVMKNNDSRGNVSLYKNVRIQAQDGHNITNGVVEVSGDLNIYGGTIQGAALTDKKTMNDGTESDIDSYGGAVSVTASGHLYMNAGTIIGGTAEWGGAVFTKGTVKLEGGTVAGGTADDGGMFYVAGGTLDNNGVALDGASSQAARGGLVYVSGGKVKMYGTSDAKLSLTGGTVVSTIVPKSGNTEAYAKDFSGSGGVFYVDGGEVDLDYCQINGSKTMKREEGSETPVLYTELNSHGGSAFFVSGGKVNVDGSEVNGYTGGVANRRGGTIYISGGAMTVASTTVKAGYSTVNGAVVYMQGGSFTVDNGASLDATDFYTEQRPGGNTYGANVMVEGDSSKFYLKVGGEITGGVSANLDDNSSLDGNNFGGGNVRVSAGTFTMTGGSITNGKHLGEKEGGGANVFITGGSFIMSGGEITGGQTNNIGGGILKHGGTLKISGDARITDNDNGNVYLEDYNTTTDGVTTLNHPVITLGKLTHGASIGVTLSSVGGYMTTGNTENTRDILENNYLYSDDGYDDGIDGNMQFYIGKMGCICGATSAESHLGECLTNGNETFIWNPWVSKTELPQENGKWYLTEDVNISRQQYIGNGATTDQNVYLDLNGHIVRSTDTAKSNIARIYGMWTPGVAGVKYVLSITDSSAGHVGQMIVDSIESADQGQAVWLRGSWCTFNFYRGTIDGTNAKLTNSVSATGDDGLPTSFSGRNGAVIANDGGTFNMYGGKIIGGTTRGGGGAVFSGAGKTAVMNMSGGEIVGGTAYCFQTRKTNGDLVHNHGVGGAVYVGEGSFTISGDAVIDGGTAGQGGAVSVGASATMQMEGGFIKNGQADPAIVAPNKDDDDATLASDDFLTSNRDCGYGGNIHHDGAVTVTAGTISDGKALKGSGGGLGGNICFFGNLTLSGGTITGGNAETGGNLGTISSNSQATLENVKIQKGTAQGMGGNIAVNVRPGKGITINAGTEISGGNAETGGNIGVDMRVASSTNQGEHLYQVITMNGGIVKDGTATTNGGNIYLNGGVTNDKITVEGKETNVKNNATFNMNGGSITGGSANQGNNLYLVDYAHVTICGLVTNTVNSESGEGNNVYVHSSTSDITLKDNGVISNGLTATKDPITTVRNVYLNSGSFHMEGGEISGGYLSLSSSHGANVYLNTSDARFDMSGGVIKNGVCGLTVTSDTGIAKTQKEYISSGSGGNVYIKQGDMELSGDARVTGGKVANSGGNIYVSANANASLTMKDNATITDGLSARSNGGNVYVGNGAKFTLIDGTISGGRTGDGGGNVYFNGTFEMRGGVLEKGQSALEWEDFSQAFKSDPIPTTDPYTARSNSCVFIVNGTFILSGGQIDTGVGCTNYDAKRDTITLSGAPKIGGTGLFLSSTERAGGEFEEVIATDLTDEAEIYITASGLAAQEGGRVKLTVETSDSAYTAKLFKEASPDVCQVAYLDDGVYLYNGAEYRFHCLCGVNDSEVKTKGHLGDCTGEELVWRAWKEKKLPNEPGNWFLYYGTNKDTPISMAAGELKFDYYKSGDEWVPVRALLAVDEYGKFITLGNGNYQQAKDANGKAIWMRKDGKAIDSNAANVLPSYEINVDLNGYKMEGPSAARNLSFYGRNQFSKANITSTDEQAALANHIYEVVADDGVTVKEYYSTHRQAGVTYTIVDASQGHTAVLATYGKFSGKTRTSVNEPQGTNIWMNWKGDTLNTYRATIDASTARHGWGMALTVNGTANLYDTKLIGGIAQGYYSKAVTAVDGAGKEHTIYTLGGSVSGGGTLEITDTGVVNMFGGTIMNGTSIYRYMDATNGVNVDRAVGGGNVFLDGGTFTVKGNDTYLASITGGKALYYAEPDGEANELSGYTTTQGGGVYVNSGTFKVEGNVSITNNTCGIVSASVAGAISNTIIPTATIGDDTSNVFLNGNVMEVKNLTGTVGFTMTGSSWEGAFAQVDVDDTSYCTNGKLMPDDSTQANDVVLYDGSLRYRSSTVYRAGYGSASIAPEEKDIANGLSLGGYGNILYSGSGERARITRYWAHSDAKVEAAMPKTNPNYDGKEMMAVAMAISDGEGDTVIIINVDYNNISEDVAGKVKRLVSKATGVPQDNITISASHQHNGPGVDKTYWMDVDGNYTHAPTTNRSKGTTETGTYLTMLYSGEKLEAWEELEVRTDYAKTFYTNVLKAAEDAYNDLKPVTNVSAGVLDTRTPNPNDGKRYQFNFVRNIALYDPGAPTILAGMWTDNHTTVATVEGYIQKYESELDTTMQLVKYERNGHKTIVLANFQSHPHLGESPENLNITGGAVGAFREQLRALNSNYEVIYFSGAGGNVNSTTMVNNDGIYDNGDGKRDELRSPWYDASDKSLITPASDVDQRAQRVNWHGLKLAQVANAFLSGTAMKPVTGTNVRVSVQEFTYNVWEENPSAKKISLAKKLVDWEKGGYNYRPGEFGNSYIFVDGGVNTGKTYWQYFVGEPATEDRIYSLFHANGVRKRLLRKQAENMTGNFEITAYDLGGVGFIAAPYEMFQENGQAIKGNTSAAVSVNYVESVCGYDTTTGKQSTQVSSPYDITIIASQANGANGYIPSKIGYDNGGYATDTSLYAPGTGEQLVTAYVDMLYALKGE